MLNNVRLEVEEESEVSLELLRFVRQQQQEGFRPDEELSAVKQKLMLLDSAAEGRLILPSQVKTVNNKCCC
nr:hypothetical protein [Tanacetum cinerariifolium]